MSFRPYANGIREARLRIVRGAGDSPGTELLNFTFPYCAIQTPHNEKWPATAVVQYSSNFDINGPSKTGLKNKFGVTPIWKLSFAGILVNDDVVQNFADMENLEYGNVLLFTPHIEETTYVDIPVLNLSGPLEIQRGIGTNPAGVHILNDFVFEKIDMVRSITIRKITIPGTPTPLAVIFEMSLTP